MSLMSLIGFGVLNGVQRFGDSEHLLFVESLLAVDRARKE